LQAVADYLTSEYATFFQKYNSLLQSDNYATQRQSLKLLMELLLDRTNFSVMTKYISETSNLKIVMQVL
jgi:calcium binding protein 39